MKKITGTTASLAVGICLAFAAAVEAAPLVLFDQAHDQRFVIARDEPLQLSRLAAVMKGEGLDVRSSTVPLTDESLKGVDALVISGPFKALEAAEIDALVRFVERGGRLAAMLHIGPPLASLLQRLQVGASNYVVNEQENIIEGDPKNFQVKKLEKIPLFEGLDHFSTYGCWALMSITPSARIIASTSTKGWVDMNGDKKLSHGDVVQSFGVVLAGEIGSGRYVVFGDDAVFQNKFMDEQNSLLAKNLARWLTK